MPPDSEDRWSVGKLLTWTKDFLQKKGSESPRLDAEVLLASVLKCERVRLYTQYEDEVGDKDRAKFRELVKKRADGAPVAYLVGRKEFYSLSFAVSSAVLIPRADTESVVVEALAKLKGVEGPRCVDIGTGSGCLAVTCAYHHKTARFVAVDLSPEALTLARKNAETHKVLDRIEFIEGDLLASLADRPPFDLILSNPPYIATTAIPTLEPGVRDFEPHLALDGGEDGLRVVDRLIAESIPLLKVGGHLILEIGSDQEAPVRSLIADRPEFKLAPTVRDAANHPRVILARRIADHAG